MLLVAASRVLAVVLVAAQNSNEEFNALENNSKSLAKSLRRQLMYDNYDYSQDELTNTGNESYKKRTFEKLTRRNFYVTRLSISDINLNARRRGQNINISNINKGTKNNKNFVKNVVSKKDLLYYLDDDRFKTETSVKIEPTAKYKLLKGKRQFRRSGRARFIQEENKDGVAIVNLDKGPFPELRLPNSRRQYMHDHGEVMTEEEEVSPPAVNTSDPEAAADDIENLTEIIS